MLFALLERAVLVSRHNRCAVSHDLLRILGLKLAQLGLSTPHPSFTGPIPAAPCANTLYLSPLPLFQSLRKPYPVRD